jgi:hypothetical protein
MGPHIYDVETVFHWSRPDLPFLAWPFKSRLSRVHAYRHSVGEVASSTSPRPTVQLPFGRFSGVPWIEWQHGSTVDVSGSSGSSTRKVGLRVVCSTRRRSRPPGLLFFCPGRGLSGRRCGYHLSAAVDRLDAGSAAPACLPGVTPRGWAARKTRTASCVGHTVCPARRRCALTTARRRVCASNRASCELGAAGPTSLRPDCVHLHQAQVSSPAGYLLNQHGSMLGVSPNRIVVTTGGTIAITSDRFA